MNKNNETFYFLKHRCLMLGLFVEMSKPFLSESDYVFCKDLIKGIDFKRNVYNINIHINNVMNTIFNHCSFNKK